MLVFPDKEVSNSKAIVQRSDHWIERLESFRSETSKAEPNNSDHTIPTSRTQEKERFDVDKNFGMSNHVLSLELKLEKDKVYHQNQQQTDIMHCSSPLQLDYLYRDYHDINFMVPTNLGSSNSSFSPTAGSTSFRYHPSYPHRNNCNCGFHPIPDSGGTTRSSVQSSQESTPLPPPSNDRHNINGGDDKSSSNGAVMGETEDVLFSQHMDMLLEYNTSPNVPRQMYLDRKDFTQNQRYSSNEQGLPPFPQSEIYHCNGRQYTTAHYQPTPRSSLRFPAPNQPLPASSNVDSRHQQYLPWIRSVYRESHYPSCTPQQPQHSNDRHWSSPPYPILSTRQDRQSLRISDRDKYFAENNTIAIPVDTLHRETKIKNAEYDNEVTETGNHDVENIQDVFVDDSEDSEYVNEADENEEEGEDDDDDGDGDSDEWTSSTSSAARKRRRVSSRSNSVPTSPPPKRVSKRSKSSSSDAIKSSVSDHLPPRKKASAAARNILMDWLVANEDHPYPTKKQKLELSVETGLSLKQIVHWMSNIRKRRMIPLLSGRRQAASMVDVKFLEDINHRRQQMSSIKK